MFRLAQIPNQRGRAALTVCAFFCGATFVEQRTVNGDGKLTLDESRATACRLYYKFISPSTLCQLATLAQEVYYLLAHPPSPVDVKFCPDQSV